MAYATTNATTFNLSARIRSAIEAFRAARAQRGEYNRTVRELEGLNDRELLDLGISRYDIHGLAERHIYG